MIDIRKDVKSGHQYGSKFQTDQSLTKAKHTNNLQIRQVKNVEYR